MSKIADFPWGWIATYDDNEIEIVSTISDPPKIRLAVLADVVTSQNPNLGLITFNTKRTAAVGSDGEHDEWCGVGGRLIHGGTAGAVGILVKGPGDSGVREAALFAPNGVVFNVPLLGQAAQPKKIALRSMANNRLVCAEAGGEAPLIANRDAAGLWETFEIIVLE